MTDESSVRVRGKEGRRESEGRRKKERKRERLLGVTQEAVVPSLPRGVAIKGV